MRGVLVGGWNYVIAAYSVTTVILVSYAVSLFVRLTEERGPRTEDQR